MSGSAPLNAGKRSGNKRTEATNERGRLSTFHGEATASGTCPVQNMLIKVRI